MSKDHLGKKSCDHMQSVYYHQSFDIISITYGRFYMCFFHKTHQIKTAVDKTHKTKGNTQSTQKISHKLFTLKILVTNNK